MRRISDWVCLKRRRLRMRCFLTWWRGNSGVFVTEKITLSRALIGEGKPCESGEPQANLNGRFFERAAARRHLNEKRPLG